MSDQPTPSQATPATESPAPAAPTAAPLRARDRVAQTAAELRAHLKQRREAEAAEDDGDESPAPSAKKAEPKAEPKATATEKKIDKLETKIEAKGGDVPDQKRNESDSDYEMRLSKTLGELERTRKERDSAKAAGDRSLAEAKKLQKLLDDGKANPLKILKHLGLTFEDVARGINDDKFKEPEKEFQLPAELQAEIDELKADRQARKAAEVKAAAEAQHTADVKKVSGFVDSNADDFPFCATAPWAVAQAVQQCSAAGETNVLPYLQKIEASLAENVETFIKGDKSMAAMIKKNPELKKALAKYAEVADPESVRASEETEISAPTSISELGTEPPARSRKLSKADRILQAAKELREKRRKERDSDED